MTPDADVVVVGSGPAGLAVAAACVAVGLPTVLVAPDPGAVWPQTYGCWADELTALGLAAMTSSAWPSVRVVGHHTHQIPRAYALIDNARLHTHLTGRLLAGGGRVVVGTAVGAQHFTWGSRLQLGSGEAVAARVLIDASGAGSPLVRGAGPPAAFQAAYGYVAHFADPPIPTGTCTLMDWSPPPGIGGAEADPTFLYAMDLGDGLFLVQETSLARRRPLDRSELAARLSARLALVGAVPVGVLREETVLIPMGGAVPPAQAVVATGAAGGLVHPATGYSVAAGLRAAPALAAALRAAADQGGDPDAVARAGWDALWPPDRRRARRLERYGLERLLAMPGPAGRGFFDAFFSLPGDRWGPYLAGTATSAQVARTMAAVFRAAPWPVRRALVGGRR